VRRKEREGAYRVRQREVDVSEGKEEERRKKRRRVVNLESSDRSPTLVFTFSRAAIRLRLSESVVRELGV
jgi:hypothetical protein